MLVWRTERSEAAEIQVVRRSFWNLSSAGIPNRPTVDFRTSAVRMSQIPLGGASIAPTAAS